MEPDMKPFARVSGILSALLPFALILRLYVYWQEIEPATGFFKEEALFCHVYNVAGFLVFFLCLVLSFLSGRKQKRSEKKAAEEARSDGEAKFEPSLIFDAPAEEPARPGELPLASRRCAQWRGVFSAFASFLPAFSLLCYAALFLTQPEASRNHLIWAVFSAVCGFFLFFFALLNSPRINRFRAFALMLPAFWSTWRLVQEYQDLDRFTNKTMYVGQFLFLISCTVFFCYLAQMLLGEKALFRPGQFAFSALPVIFFGCSARLPQLIAAVFQMAELDLVDGAALLVDLSLTVFVAGKMRTFLQKK